MTTYYAINANNSIVATQDHPFTEMELEILKATEKTSEKEVVVSGYDGGLYLESKAPQKQLELIQQEM